MAGELTSYVKLVLRLSCDDLDEVVRVQSDAGRDDLVASGVSEDIVRPEEGDTDLPPLVKHALACYVAAHFDRDDPKESERWWLAYERLRARLAMDGRYREGARA